MRTTIVWLIIVFGILTACGSALAQQPQSWTGQDKLALTYYFYWYNVHTGASFTNPDGTPSQTLHPPDSYLSTYAWTDVAFHQRELSDMAAAGIDVALAVYSSDPPSLGWDLPGLPAMVQAEQALAQQGLPAPKIGFFLGLPSPTIDLTTPAGMSRLYKDFHDFFTAIPRQFWAMIDSRPIVVLYSSASAAYSQSAFDYVNQQFQQEFGTTPYMVRHNSWTGIKTDAAYTGWPSWYSATFNGDVASVTPGADNLGVAVSEGVHWVVDRQCGDRYQAQWNQVTSRGARLVIVETWNELFEGESISASKEYGRRYIDLTAQNVKRWKAAANPPLASPTIVWANLGGQIYQTGLYHDTNFPDGAWLTSQIAGKNAVYANRTSSPPSYQIYFSVDDRFLTVAPSGVWVTVEYLDLGTMPWRLDYEGAQNTFTGTAPVIPQNTGLWKRQAFYLPDATFRKTRGGGVYDFRIDDGYDTKGLSHYFSSIWITKTPPSGQPPVMPLVPDLTVQPGGSTDVALTVSDASGNPLPLSLASNPGFATLEGNTGAQVVHLAPSSADIRSCADVPGPGVTSSPSYTITAVAIDPNSSLPAATTFHVNVSSLPALNLSAPTLAFSAVAGTTTAVTSTLTISNSAGASFQSGVSVATQSGGSWLQWQTGASTSAGKVNLQIGANPAGLSPGTYFGSIAITAPALDQSPRNVPVTFTVSAAGTLAVSGRSLSFNAAAGTDPPLQTLTISNSGPANSVLIWTATPTTAAGGPWLSVNPDSGSNSGNIQVLVHAASLAPGSYSGSIAITSPGAQSSPATVTVTLNVSQPPAIQAIFDSWDYTPGIAPGAWVTITGTGLATGPPQTWNLNGVQQLPTTLGGVTVSFNSTLAALYYISPTQINALVPAGIAPGPVQVEVQANGVSGSPFTITATATLPSIYALPNTDGSAFFVTAALQGTGFLVGNSTVDPRVVRAALPGDILDLYMGGLGATADPSKFLTNQVFSGAYPVSASVTATVGGEQAPVLFAGLTSPGLYLVRIAIPSDLAAGPQAIRISAGGVQTRSSLVLMLNAARPNLVQNGSFELPLTGSWQSAIDGTTGAAATIQRTTSMAVDGSYSAQVAVTTAAAHTSANSPCLDCAVQFWQTGLALQQSQVYTLQFWAKADTARTMRISNGSAGPPFQNYGLSTAVAIGGDWQRYVVYFQATASDQNGRLTFYFGDQAGNTWLDAVVLQ